MFGLNPFKREIYLIKYGNNPATFVVGYEVYLKRAERSDKWNGLESGTEGDVTGMKAWAKVYRKDWDKPLYHEVYYDEYAQYKDEWIDGKKTGKKTLTKFWAEKPRTMLKKVAICQAFRMAFPDEFAGMPYTAEEMPVDHSRLPAAEVVPEPAKVAPAQAKAEPTPTPAPAQREEPPAYEEGEIPFDLTPDAPKPELTGSQMAVQLLMDKVVQAKKVTLEVVRHKLREGEKKAGYTWELIPESMDDAACGRAATFLTAWANRKNS